MKILWHSNAPWAHTGYGNQTRLFVDRLQSLGHEMAIHAFFGLQGGNLNLNGVTVYPSYKHDYGLDVIDAHARNHNAQIILSLMDAWVFQPQMVHDPIKWIPWFPVDSEPLPIAVARKVAHAYRRIVFTKFAEKQVNDAGLDCYYVPHGVDTNTFQPVGQVEARERLDIDQDLFLIGMVAANKGTPSRKNFTRQLDAFKMLKDKHDDVRMYLHTSREGWQGVNLPEYAQHIGLVVGRDVVFCHQYQNILGFDDTYMNTIYNAFDVHTLASMGEGFGIPIVEAQAAGCPVIVGDWTSMGELCFSGWKIDKGEAVRAWTPVGAYQYIAPAEAIYERYEMAYRMKGNQDYRERARKGALAYDADRVTERYWKPVLEDIEQSLEANDGA